MAEYIEREAAKDAVCKAFVRWGSEDQYHESTHQIDRIPAADVVAVRHGRWIELENGDCKCSLCGCYHHTWEAHGYYCQHCGARMDKDDNEE